jgi:hypothetical protein
MDISKFVAGFILRVKRFVRFPLNSQVLVVLTVALGIHWYLLTFSDGYVSWVNFIVPYSGAQYRTFTDLLGSWGPFQYMGAPDAIPPVSVVQFVVQGGPLVILSSVLGPVLAAKTYAILATVFLGATFLLLLRSFVKSYWAQLGSAVLLLANPFQLQLYGQGDYFEFVAEAFVFLAIYLLWCAIANPPMRWLWFPASMISLLLALPSYSLFVLGVGLYCAFLILYASHSAVGPLRGRLLAIGKALLRLSTLPLLLAPLILSLLSTPIDVSPASAYAPTFSTFVLNSANPLALFLGLGYVSGNGPTPQNSLEFQMVAATSGAGVATASVVLLIALVVATWVAVILLRDSRAYFLLGLTVVASLLGSGSTGPLGGFNSYLYLHAFGYQVLNASYLWDWSIIVPVFAIAFSLLVEGTTNAISSSARLLGRPEGYPQGSAALPFSRLGAAILNRRTRLVSVFAIVVVILSIVLATLPFAVGAQNGPLGIHETNYPTDYTRIPGLLDNLIGPSYAGVALFNPDSNWFLFNSTHSVQNAFFLFPTVRTPGLPFYASPPYNSNFYYYWVYDEFYSNETKFLGQFLALAGIEYLLVFYGTQSASFYPYFLQSSYGKNASELMAYQTGIVPVVTAKDFAIYRDLYFSNVAVSLNNVSIVTGGYSELNAMAYAGVNLTNQGIVFPTDIPPGGCNRYMDRTDRVFAPSTNSLYGLGLVCTAVDSSNPVGDASAGTAPTWDSSYREVGGTIWDSWPTPLAVATGESVTIQVPVDTGGCTTTCDLWLPVRFAGDGGPLTFQWENAQWTINTTKGWQGVNNSMVWVELPFALSHGTAILRITSVSGRNAVGTVYVAPRTSLASWLTNLAQRNMTLLTVSGKILQPPTADFAGQSSTYAQLTTSEALDGVALDVRAVGDSPETLNVSLPDRTSGWLSMLVGSVGKVVFVASTIPETIFGFDTRDYNDTNFTFSWIRIPLQAPTFAPNATFRLLIDNGSVYLSEITFTPLSTYGPSIPSIAGETPSIRSEHTTSAVSFLNLSVGPVNSTGSMISGSVRFNSTVFSQYLASAEVTPPPPVGSDLAVRYAISPGMVLSLDGITIGQGGTVGLSQFSSGLLGDANVLPGSMALNLTLESFGGPRLTDFNGSFTVWIEFVKIELYSGIMDLSTNSSWRVTAGNDGYTVQGTSAPLVLVRVPYFPDLTSVNDDAQLAASFGTVDSLVWNEDNASAISISTTSPTPTEIGYSIAGVSLGAWAAVEYLWVHRARRPFS